MTNLLSIEQAYDGLQRDHLPAGDRQSVLTAVQQELGIMLFAESGLTFTLNPPDKHGDGLGVAGAHSLSFPAIRTAVEVPNLRIHVDRELSAGVVSVFAPTGETDVDTWSLPDLNTFLRDQLSGAVVVEPSQQYPLIQTLNGLELDVAAEHRDLHIEEGLFTSVIHPHDLDRWSQI